MSDFITIGNGKTVPRDGIAYRVRGSSDFPELERVTVQYGTGEIAIKFPDSPRSSGSRENANSIFSTPEEAVEDRIARLRAQFEKAVHRTEALLKKGRSE